MFIEVRLSNDATGKGGIVTWTDKSTASMYVFESRLGSITLRKRSAYPRTFVRTSHDHIECGYGVQPGQDPVSTQEFLMCKISNTTGKCTVDRDIYCTLPLFMYGDRRQLAISDDFETVIRLLPRITLDTSALARLILSPCINNQTLCEEVRLLDERSRLEWHKNGIRVSKKPHIQEAVSNPDPREFKNTLEWALRIAYHQTSDCTVGFEVSGGIDSATMPLYLAAQGLGAPLLGSMNFPDAFGVSQAQKLSDLAAHTKGELINTKIDSKHDYPLARFFSGPRQAFTPHPFYQYQEIYTEALSKLAQEFSSRGVDVVYTGIGGDELFENNPTTTRATAQGAKLTRLRFISEQLTSEQLTKDAKALGTSVATVLANSAYFAGQSRNKIYIDNGIWPLSPFLNLQLYQYTQGLDIVFRSNKNILRSYYEAAHYPRSIFEPVRNEHFGRFFEDAIMSNYAKLLETSMQKSFLAENGYIDKDEFLAYFDNARWRENNQPELFTVFRVATAEIILQAMFNHTEPTRRMPVTQH